MSRPFADACLQNRLPILQVLREQLAEPVTVLEIGSGTGQHAVYFAEQLPHLQWQPTDRARNLAGIDAWIQWSGLASVLPPLALDVSDEQWEIAAAAAIFSANTTHIMAWQQVAALFAGVGRIALPGAKLLIYGPFNYHNQYTSDSNRQFDAMLRARDPRSGIRNFEDLDALANAAGLRLLQDYPMPANNRTLVWQKPATSAADG